MKTDVIMIGSDGSGMEEALLQAEKTAIYKGLSRKEALHLRLLAEETLGMMRSITGKTIGRFWIEDEKGEFRLHLKVLTSFDLDKREKLIAVSSSGRNEAAKGIMGKIRTFFDPVGDAPVFYDVAMESVGGATRVWSMRAYEQSVQSRMEQKQAGAAEEWDELEKSVVTHVADDIKVSVQGREAEMIIIKKISG